MTPGLAIWCGRWDLNPHPERLAPKTSASAIPPRPHKKPPRGRRHSGKPDGLATPRFARRQTGRGRFGYGAPCRQKASACKRRLHLFCGYDTIPARCLSTAQSSAARQLQLDLPRLQKRLGGQQHACFSAWPGYPPLHPGGIWRAHRSVG